MHDAINPLTVYYDTEKVWLRKFKIGEFDFCDRPRYVRPLAVNEELLLVMIEENSRSNNREDALIHHNLSGHQLHVRRGACMNF